MWKIENKNSLKRKGKRSSRALLDGVIVGSIGYQTFGRALVYLVYRQQIKKRGQPHPNLPCANVE